jgi:hypothetical protein
MRIDSSGRLLVGTSTSPTAGNGQYSNLVIQGYPNTPAGAGHISLQRGQAAFGANNQIGLINFGDNTGASYAGIECYADADSGANDFPGRLVFSTTADGASSPTARMRLDSSGRLLINTSTSIPSPGIFNPALQVVHVSANADTCGISLSKFQAGNPSASPFIFQKSRHDTIGSHTILANSDVVGVIQFAGSDGSTFVPAASIEGEVDGTPGSNDMPGRLVFSTTADGASSPTERMRVASNGVFLVGKTVEDSSTAGFLAESNGTIIAVRSDSYPGIFNRLSSDGKIVSLRQDSTEEGNISVSGSTVSYNGAHLSRWSQLAAGAERIEILRGSVLSNLDEMCEWGEEDNEQLNRMKVSDVEGDKNVSGVFQSWDDDDKTYTNDFYCAMTGDFVIRIAQGTTVARGDLLMSAGDGTAKPQDDDIVRSKTIAKVTSTSVSETYADNSYCVPCVLMAC